MKPDDINEEERWLQPLLNEALPARDHVPFLASRVLQAVNAQRPFDLASAMWAPFRVTASVAAIVIVVLLSRTNSTTEMTGDDLSQFYPIEMAISSR